MGVGQRSLTPPRELNRPQALMWQILSVTHKRPGSEVCGKKGSGKWKNSLGERAQIKATLGLFCASENELEFSQVGRTQKERKSGAVNVLQRAHNPLRFRGTVGDTSYKRW